MKIALLKTFIFDNLREVMLTNDAGLKKAWAGECHIAYRIEDLLRFGTRLARLGRSDEPQFDRADEAKAAI